MKLTKIKIEELVNKIEDFLRKNELLGDVCLYFNNKRHLWTYDHKAMEYKLHEKEDISPLDYFEYAASKHILSMSFEGAFCDVMNGYTKRAFNLQDKFSKILGKYNLYYELGHHWNLTCYPSNDDMEVEYTDYTALVQTEPEHIWCHKKDVLPELREIMTAWYEMSEAVGDLGGCVIGAGFLFIYKGKPYFMSACSPWQGSLSWERHRDRVKEMLAEIGATEIRYDWGRLD